MWKLLNFGTTWRASYVRFLRSISLCPHCLLSFVQERADGHQILIKKNMKLCETNLIKNKKRQKSSNSIHIMFWIFLLVIRFVHGVNRLSLLLSKLIIINIVRQWSYFLLCTMPSNCCFNCWLFFWKIEMRIWLLVCEGVPWWRWPHRSVSSSDPRVRCPLCVWRLQFELVLGLGLIIKVWCRT